MKDNNQDKFKFFVPLTLEKGKAGSKNEMKIRGIASTKDEDADGEFLNPNGFDLGIFKSQGTFNWHHQAKNDPSAIIGEPTNARATKEGLYIEGFLYPDSEKAQQVWKTAQVLQKCSKTRRLGFSIEGKVLERDTDNPKVVTKATITGCAITHLPKNPNTLLEIIKGECDNPYYEDEPERTVSTFKKGAMDTGKGAPLMKEDVVGVNESGKKKEAAKNKKKNAKLLTKSEVMQSIMDEFLVTDEEAEEIFNLVNEINNDMKKASTTKEKPSIAEDAVTKAFATLGLKNSISKAEDEEDPEEETEEEEDDLTEEESEETDETSEEDDGVEEETEDEDPEEETEEEEEPAKPAKKVAKATTSKPLNEVRKAKKLFEKGAENNQLLKAMQDESISNTTKMSALGTLIKAVLDGQEEINERLDELSDQAMPAKSLSSVKGYKERFNKGHGEDEEVEKDKNVLSLKKDKKMIINIMDNLTFAKGLFDDEMGEDMRLMEVGGKPRIGSLNKLKAAGYTIVA